MGGNSANLRTAAAAALLIIASLLLWACGTEPAAVETSAEVEPAPSEATQPPETASGTSEETTASAEQDDASTEPSVAKAGSSLGELPPDYYIFDLDYNKMTSQEQLATGRPVFFYFFTTW